MIFEDKEIEKELAEFSKEYIEDIDNKIKRKELNVNRASELATIVVTLEDGTVLDADKESEENIKTALLALDDGEETMWLTKENEAVTLKKSDLKEALRLIGIEKRTIIFKYRKLKDELN